MKHCIILLIDKLIYLVDKILYLEAALYNALYYNLF